MEKLGVASTVLGLLAYGCVGIDSAAQPYMGKNISMVVGKLGYPTDKREMLGHTIYTWKTGNPNQGVYCNLDLGVDENNVVTSGNWEGTNGGCMALAARLR
jgi:hypothetical protein